MGIINTDHLAALIESAPLRATTGLSAANEALPYWSTRELAEYIVEGPERPRTVQDKAQPSLPL